MALLLGLEHLCRSCWRFEELNSQQHGHRLHTVRSKRRSRMPLPGDVYQREPAMMQVRSAYGAGGD